LSDMNPPTSLVIPLIGKYTQLCSC
jgi:hypothetical protein